MCTSNRVTDKSLEFVDWFEDVLNHRPGMLGTISDISAMFFVVDNVRNIVVNGERLPFGLSWNQFLIDNGLMRDLRSIPIEEGWGFDRFIELRRSYLGWVENKRIQNQ